MAFAQQHTVSLRGCGAPVSARPVVARTPLAPRTPFLARPSVEVAAAKDDLGFDPQVTVVLGTQWGDEGKGKLVDILAQEMDVVARAQGGANAGHTIYDDDGNKYALHLVPSGILNKSALCLVGNGVVVHIPGMLEEIEELRSKGVHIGENLKISDRAHLLFDLHKEVDGAREAELKGDKIGTTKRGIGPAYASKVTRNGLRVADLKDLDSFADKLRILAADQKARFGDLLDYDVEADIEQYKAYAETVVPFITDSVSAINDAFDEGKKILVEGANATMLDIDFGTYPFVTSSNPSIGGVISGLGLAPNKLQVIAGVAKAYTTRVGAGPYPTEIFGDLAEELRAIGYEYGTTTGRPRRIGWLDIVALNYVNKINGVTHLNLTKLDVLSELDEIPIGVGYKLPSGEVLKSVPADITTLEQVEVVYETVPGWKSDIADIRKWEDMPEAAKKYVEKCEELCGIPIVWIGVGPGRDAVVVKPQA